jgi:hypothetical protein
MEIRLLIQKSFQAVCQPADIKGELGFEAIRIKAATVGFYENDFAQNLFGSDRIIAGGPGISAEYKTGLSAED